MVKRIKKITKNKPTKNPRKIIIIGTEGNNKTETLYFHNFNYKQDKYTIKFASGNDTDPVKIVKNTINEFNSKELDYDYGDLAFSVFDLDLDLNKIDQLNEAKEIAKRNNVKIITSNPCFEIWYLLHFSYTTKKFNSNDELILELKKYIKAYTKNECNFDMLFNSVEIAFKNTEKLKDYNESFGDLNHPEFSNPSTFVDEIVRYLLDEKNVLK